MNSIFKKLNRLKTTDAKALLALSYLRRSLTRPLAVNSIDMESIAEGIIAGSDNVHPQLTMGLIPYDKNTLLDVYTSGKVAVLDISGGLSDRHVEGMSGAQPSYEGISSTLNVLDEDESINKIILRIQSSGGMVTGVFDCCDTIKGLSTPTVGIADGYAYSAGYALLSSCDNVYCVRDGGVGSVGVIQVLMNESKRLNKEGIEVKVIRSGEHKASLNPYESFDETIVSESQSACDAIYERFISLVADNMGITPESVADTQARCYNSDKALAIGYINGVATFDSLINIDNEVSKMDEIAQLQAENEALKAQLNAWNEAGTKTLAVLGADEQPVTAETMSLMVENQLLKTQKANTTTLDATLEGDKPSEKVDVWARFKKEVA